MFNNHLTSAAVRAKALHSDSAEERETIDCFLELQETRLSHKKMAYPDVDQLVSGQPAQLASEKAEMLKVVDGVILRPKCRVPLIYWRIHYQQ
jgi:hypothetical protein